MIDLDDKLIIQILESLSEAFPNYVWPAQILPEHNDRNEIDKHLVYCKGHGWMELGETAMSDGSVRLGQTRITSSGIDYLREKSK